MLRYIHESQQNEVLFQNIVAQNKLAYPKVYEEVHGLAAGAQVPLEIMLALNLADALLPFLQHNSVHDVPKQCTDLHVVTEEMQGWVHNEDYMPGHDAHYLVLYNITGAEPEISVGFAYAGIVVGWAWGFSATGHAHSVNALSPKGAQKGLSNNFIGRDVLRSSSLDNAVMRAAPAETATGQHFNVGHRDVRGKQISVEVAWEAIANTLVITNRTTDIGTPSGITGHYYHVNLYRRIHEQQEYEASSRHRMQRLKELKPAQNLRDLIALISDKHDTEYPIYRNGNPPDTCRTLTSTIFDISRGQVLVFTRRPLMAQEPDFVFDWHQPNTWEQAILRRIAGADIELYS